MRNLVAGDDSKLRSHLAGTLQSARHTTGQAGDGEKARRLLDEHAYDAVPDLMIPGRWPAPA